ncbi:MAG: Stp1/IreP family PP2C-type Ser/Thr phosphatase [Chloroflexota bacterium]
MPNAAPAPSIVIASRTDVGRRRDHNEDTLAVFQVQALPARIVCVVADGMGGHLAGEVASERAVDTIKERLAHGANGSPKRDLTDAIVAANARIRAEAATDAAKHGMGSTVVCVLLEGSRALFANVGDSRGYVVTASGAEQVTRDHAWVAEQVEMGTIAAADAERHPYRHILTRCLGADDNVDVETYREIDLAVGDSVVLCSDGLTEHVPDDDLARVMRESASVDSAAQRLVDLANENGGSDNISVVIARRER